MPEGIGTYTVTNRQVCVGFFSWFDRDVCVIATTDELYAAVPCFGLKCTMTQSRTMIDMQFGPSTINISEFLFCFFLKLKEPSKKTTKKPTMETKKPESLIKRSKLRVDVDSDNVFMKWSLSLVGATVASGQEQLQIGAANNIMEALRPRLT